MKFELPPALKPEALKAAAEKLRAKLPLGHGRKAEARAETADDSFSSLEDNAVDPATFAETDASIGKNSAAAAGPLENIKSAAGQIASKPAFLIGIIAAAALIVIIAAVGFIVSAAPSALPAEPPPPASGGEAVKGLVPPLRLSSGLEARIELEREKGGVYTDAEAEELLSEMRAENADLSLEKLAAHSDAAAARLYNSVP